MTKLNCVSQNSLPCSFLARFGRKRNVQEFCSWKSRNDHAYSLRVAIGQALLLLRTLMDLLHLWSGQQLGPQLPQLPHNAASSSEILDQVRHLASPSGHLLTGEASKGSGGETDAGSILLLAGFSPSSPRPAYPASCLTSSRN